MHSISMPESLISMKCCQSIGDQNFFSLDYGVKPMEAMPSKIILMMSKTQVKNQESTKFQRIKELFNQESRFKKRIKRRLEICKNH